MERKSTVKRKRCDEIFFKWNWFFCHSTLWVKDMYMYIHIILIFTNFPWKLLRMLGTQQTSQLMFCNIMILCNKLLSVVIKGNQNFFYDRFTNELRSGWRTISFIRRLYKSFLGLFYAIKVLIQVTNVVVLLRLQDRATYCVHQLTLQLLSSMMVLLLNPNFILRKLLC